MQCVRCQYEYNLDYFKNKLQTLYYIDENAEFAESRILMISAITFLLYCMAVNTKYDRISPNTKKWINTQTHIHDYLFKTWNMFRQMKIHCKQKAEKDWERERTQFSWMHLVGNSERTKSGIKRFNDNIDINVCVRCVCVCKCLCIVHWVHPNKYEIKQNEKILNLTNKRR